MSISREDLEFLRREIANCLEKLSHYFQPECKLAFVMRTPGNPDANLIVTDDDYQEMADCVQRLAIVTDKTRVM